MTSLIRKIAVSLFCTALSRLSAQTLFIPSGTIGTSTNGNVGIGTTSPGTLLSLSASGASAVSIGATGTGRMAYFGNDSYNTYSDAVGGGWNILKVGGMARLTLEAGGNSYFNTGNVGVGTTNPTSKFTVEGGNVGIDGNSSAQQFFGAAGNIAGTNTTGGVITVFGHSPNAYGDVSTPPFNGSIFVGAAGLIARGFSESSQYRGSLEFYTETANVASSRMLITHDGNVGIGTLAPTTKLTVEGGNIGVDGNTSAQQFFGAAGNIAGTNTTGGVITVFGHAPNSSGDVSAPPFNGTIFVGAAGLIARGFSESSQYRGSLEFFTETANAAASRMLITHDGNVGIGTSNPTQKLSVNGTVRAKEVIVDTGWSDYVFKPDYKLASLSEVEGAIKREGHLPGIPSATEVAEHGVSMGDMQSKLLAKVEELTLHVIAQEKEISELRREVGVLKSNSR